MTAKPLTRFPSLSAIMLGGAIVFPGIPDLAAAGLIRVSQESSPGAGDFDSNVLGTIDPFSTPLTAEDFYDHNGAGSGTDYNGPDSFLEPDHTHAFFVDTDEGLSLAIVHSSNAPGDTNGSSGSADTTISVVNDGDSLIEFLALDDPEEGQLLLDTFVQIDSVTLDIHNEWAPEREDGYIAGSLDGSAWSLFVEFDGFNNLDGWSAFSNDGTPIPLVLEQNRRVRFDTPVENVIPEPSGIVLLGLGAMGLFAPVVRRKRSA